MATSSPTLRSSGLLALALVAGCSLLIDTDPKKLAPLQDVLGGDAGPVVSDCKACDDHVDCTLDVCDPKLGCMHQPQATRCDDKVNCTVDSCDVQLGCQHQASDAHCEFCAPGSVCDPAAGGCAHATTLRDCSDNDPCTTDACKVALMMCISTPTDADGDGYPAAEVEGHTCQGTDCDDSNPQIHPGAPEICDGRDNDCNGMTDETCAGSHDTCASAGSVMLAADETGALVGTFAGLNSDFDVSCGSQGTPDAIYGFKIQQVSDIVIDSLGSETDVVVAAGPSCDATGFGFACAAPMNDHRTRLVFHRYDPATQGAQLFVLIEPSQKNKAGGYRVRVSITPAQPDDCATGVFDFTGCGTLIGFIEDQQPANAWGTLAGSCSPATLLGRAAAPEAVVKLTPSNGMLNFTATSDAFTPTLYARSTCTADLMTASTEYGCARGGLLGPASLQITPPSGDPVYVVVDSATNNARYTLQCQ